ncbi:glycosyltransferase [Paenibacillus sp. sgz302251]|uniref:glycosyltransferase n=1 Tax=Paenibacillus sp. sgz302251 TaxID=3414493 RepID=UPI003C79ACE2
MNNKKKLLFMLINMNVGGTEKALLNMISEIPKERYEITILMLEEKGGFLDYIPSEVRVEYLKGYKDIKHMLNKPPQVLALDFVRNKKIINAVNLLFVYLLSKIKSDRSLFFKFIIKKFPVINEEYDLAVAYAGPMEFISFFVVHKIKAKKKIQWIHFDVSKIGFNSEFASRIFKKFDKIFVVSEEGRNKLIQRIPDIKDRTEKFLNILSPDLITQMSDEGAGFEDNFEGIRILTVGRLSQEKGQDLTIPVLARLKEEGYNIRWYCIGEGNARSEYEKLVKYYGLENDYILMGANANPYPHMKQCDIYVQPSRHEGYCITLSEARCFTNPIVSTNFTGAKEQVSHRQTGLIVGFDTQQIYIAIKELLDDENLRNKIRSCLEKELVTDTKSEMDKLYKVLKAAEYDTR